MKEIKVWVYGRQNPIIFDNVEDYYETRKALTIVQVDIYVTKKTRIFKQSLQMYNVTDAI